MLTEIYPGSEIFFRSPNVKPFAIWKYNTFSVVLTKGRCSKDSLKAICLGGRRQRIITTSTISYSTSFHHIHSTHSLGFVHFSTEPFLYCLRLQIDLGKFLDKHSQPSPFQAFWPDFSPLFAQIETLPRIRLMNAYWKEVCVCVCLV